MLVTSTLALMLFALAIDTPSESTVKACEQQAQAAVGAPAVSPRSQPNAAAPSDDTQQQGRSDTPPPPRRRTPGKTQQDIEAAQTPLMPSSDARDQYRVAYEACVRARAR